MHRDACLKRSLVGVRVSSVVEVDDTVADRVRVAIPVEIRKIGGPLRRTKRLVGSSEVPLAIIAPHSALEVSVREPVAVDVRELDVPGVSTAEDLAAGDERHLS